MYVTIRVRPSARGDCDASGVPPDLAAAAADLGLRILPMHPGVADGELSRYFHVDLEDLGRAEAVAEHLRQVPSVDAAYVKPPEGPP